MGLRTLVSRRCTVHDVLMWTPSTNTPGGKPSYSLNPTAITVRWDDTQEEIIDAYGRTVISKAMMMSPTSIPVASWVWRGTLAQWQALATYPSLPTTLQGGWEVILASQIPDFKGVDLLFIARLGAR